MSGPDGQKHASETPGAAERAARHDEVNRVASESDQSFPASDPPSWSSGAAISPGDGEEPPAGRQAAWSVEAPSAAEIERAEDGLSERTGTSPAGPEDDVDVPVPPEDALQG